MHKLLIALSFSCILFACGAKDTASPEVANTEKGPPPVETRTTEASPTATQTTGALPVETKKVLTEEEALANIRTFYAETMAKLDAGTLKKDSIEYYCDEMAGGGFVILHSGAGKALMVENSYNMGDHYGQTDQWYFQDGKLVFLFSESGSWQFGGKMMRDADGNETPGSIDNIDENRYYFNDGSLIKHLAKSYKLESWKKATDPDKVPNETMPHNGEMPESLKFIKAVMATREVDCGLLE
jgi:hypothetical protein